MDERRAEPALSQATEATLTASRALLGIAARSVAGALELVSLPQFRILVVLSADGPLRVTTLAQRMGAVPSTFSRTLDRLAEAGWIERSGNPESRREVLVDLSARGRDLVHEVTERRRQEIRTVLASLPVKDRQAVARALAIFNTAAGEPSTEELLILGL